MRILLLAPPIEDFFFTPQRAYPLGLLYLAGALRRAGHVPVVMNAPLLGRPRTIPPPPVFRPLSRYYRLNKSPFRLFYQYTRFGPGSEELERLIRQAAPDVVGIAAGFSAYLPTALAAARSVKRIDCRIPVVVGGRAATAHPRLVLEDLSVDFVLRGEAEETLVQFVDCLQSGRSPEKITGLCYRREDGRLRLSPDIAVLSDLEAIAEPARDVIDGAAYRYHGILSTALLASRGCRNRCGFCAINEPYRHRRVEQIVREMESCYHRGIRHFNFEDDSVTMHPEFSRLLQELTDRFAPTIKISFMNGILSGGLTEPLCRKLVAAGLTHLDFSIASSDPAVRRGVARTEPVSSLYENAQWFAVRAIPVTVHYIVGLPTQQWDAAVSDLRELAGRPVLLGPSIYYPVTESALFAHIGGLFPEEIQTVQQFRSSAAVYDRDISRDRILTAVYAARIINYLKRFLDEDPERAAVLRELLQESPEEPSEAEYGMVDSGLELLVRVLRAGRMYRAVPGATGTQRRFRLVPEEFVDREDFSRIISELTVVSLHGRSVRLPRRPRRGESMNQYCEVSYG